MKRGGYSCAMNNCSNISGRGHNISFFYFPKDPDRAKLWLEKCNNSKINTTPENLHKNYKVCGNHFKSSMFLNDLKNRLQPHAIPEPIRNDNDQSSENNATSNLSDKSEENTLISHNNNNLISNVHEEDHVESVLHVQHQYTQTESMISNHSPRKTILRGRIRALHR
ncbi:PREDICTED: 52 kDa repressor of the inhibitor of the protein kinase [Trachymyrmex cornetzi]|uniref:52 kDa repressor of the inhibitor of the protein kinase n=1 Tax=Trachymyrmex cornetzi TaxID=471704 RepID=A0A151JM88_9HYME|nr:PREDICTED: 52 kDa repressor of the inhibitor of the protein kinase [Trachymyrmex cornetzi]XP_018358478.1 PREDICTED: 52 kDa repressor of the inhibitor of the protein kinase [Trachymyrmex cornetzi]KYN26653.1 52 kDa repressor of the inhibitor of the protein kinase [Trachymyrmex cornetzi]